MSDTSGSDITKAPPRVPVAMGQRGIQLRTVDELARVATMIFQSGLAPKSFQNVNAVGVAVLAGMEIGLGPMQSLQSIAVINGRPSIYGDALPALVQASGVLAEFREWFEADGKVLSASEAAGEIRDNWVACCYSRRIDQSEGKTTRFSVSDAKRAKLWGKPGPWQDYTKRMMQMRARSWNLRDNAADALRGMRIVEEEVDTNTSDTPSASQPNEQRKRIAEKLDALKPASVKPPTRSENGELPALAEQAAESPSLDAPTETPHDSETPPTGDEIPFDRGAMLSEVDATINAFVRLPSWRMEISRTLIRDPKTASKADLELAYKQAVELGEAWEAGRPSNMTELRNLIATVINH